MCTREEFCNGLYFASAWRDMIQHQAIYSKTVDDKDKDSAKKEIRGYLENNVLIIYKENFIAFSKHVELIEQLQNYISTIKNTNCEYIFNNFTFGHAQKLLNMILKYFWCAGKMDNYKTVIPPSFPIDSIK